MKTNLRRLSAILKLFNPEDFYVLDIRKVEICLQGNFNPNIVKQALSLKFKQSISENGYIQFDRYLYTITLT